MKSRPALYGAVALAAVLAYWGSLHNGFVFADQVIVRDNPLAHAADGWWRAFTQPYWPARYGGFLYRPITILSYWLDFRWAAGVAWFHAVNVLWNAGVAVLVAAFARRWVDEWGALAAGLLFAVHPVHVEAVANVVGRAELIAAAGAVGSVALALAGDRLGLSLLLWVVALGAKEDAAVVPALVALGWLFGLVRPSRRRMLTYLAAWVVVGALYAVVRGIVLHPYAQQSVAVEFLGASPVAVRLSAVAALADVARLLVFPLHLRVDYSPAERTLVTTPLDWRFAAGCLALAVWALLIVLAWRRRRRVEAFGLAWIAVAFSPVANIVFPSGVLLAERTLYLPSVGLVLAAGAWVARARSAAVSRRRAFDLALAGAVLAGGLRTVLRVPVWRTNESFALSILEDSPRSYLGFSTAGQVFLSERKWEEAAGAFRHAAGIWPWDARLYLMEADADLHLGRAAPADSLLHITDRLCAPCRGMYLAEAGNNQVLGDTAIARYLLEHYRALGRP